MGTRTPRDAFQRFIAPLKSSISCLGSAKILTTPNGDTTPNQLHGWILNKDGKGIRQQNLRFVPRMQYEIIEADEDSDDKWRVRTRAYRYEIYANDIELLAFHWHPNSSAAPHLHLCGPLIVDSGVITPRSHIASGRVSLESVVGQLIRDNGWEPQQPDWANRLMEHESLFKLCRKWG